MKQNLSIVSHLKSIVYVPSRAIILLTFLCSFNAGAQYKEGFQAYVGGHYKLAQSYWLKAAEQKDPKSMFNLGLLHEQGSLGTANLEKAKKWYALAETNGYSAAAYHHGLLILRTESTSDLAIELIERSAEQGYAPAKRYLEKGRVVSSNALANNRQFGTAEKYLSEAWLNIQRPNKWTIQLLAFENIEKVQRFIEEYGLHEKAAYYAERHDGGTTLYKLLYGTYDSKDKATFARQNLPDYLAQHGPWLRQLSSVQAITKR